MKKLLFLTLLVAIVGIVAGFMLAKVQVDASSARTSLSPEELSKQSATVGPLAEKGKLLPKAVVDNEVFNFGTMDKSGRSSHDFVISNEGQAPLILIKGKTTCKCTMAKLDKESVMPGESTKINIEWTAREYSGPFEQVATIQTNDPRRPEIELKIKGMTTTMMQFLPDELVLGRVSAGHPASGKVRLLAHTKEPVEILGFECAELETAKYFEVGLTPLTAKELKGETNVKNGYSIDVALKPGLPQGAFQQTIRFKTSLATAKMVELPVKGLVGSDISILGRGWNKDKGLLTLGLVDGAKGAQRTLRLVARGLHRKGLELKIAEVWPKDSLVAKLGKTTDINSGTASLTPLEIEIPKGSRPANHYASKQGRPGRIVLETNHAYVPKIVILVQFAIAGG
ncbi:MAG: DUF1573 domain-containing protein [Pirellulales bacterium]|nr:DUF1573 domain-containing protein [Pirellulales bacterium]